jgi:hypothetical protein
MKLMILGVLYFSCLGTLTQAFIPVQKYFCPIDPKKIDNSVIQDSLDNFILDQIGIITDSSFAERQFLVRLQYNYCEESPLEDVQTLKKICKYFYPRVKKKYKKFKSVKTAMSGKKIEKMTITQGHKCSEKIGLELRLLIIQ